MCKSAGARESPRQSLPMLIAVSLYNFLRGSYAPWGRIIQVGPIACSGETPTRSARTTVDGSGAARRCEVAPSRSLSVRQRVYVGGRQGVAADPPIAAFHLL